MPKARRSKSGFVSILSPAGNSSLLFIDVVDVAEKHSLNKKMDKWKEQKLECAVGTWKEDRWAKDVLEDLPVRWVQSSIPLHCTMPVGIKAHGEVMKAKQKTMGTSLQMLWWKYMEKKKKNWNGRIDIKFCISALTLQLWRCEWWKVCNGGHVCLSWSRQFFYPLYRGTT